MANIFGVFSGIQVKCKMRSKLRFAQKTTFKDISLPGILAKKRKITKFVKAFFPDFRGSLQIAVEDDETIFALPLRLLPTVYPRLSKQSTN